MDKFEVNKESLQSCRQAKDCLLDRQRTPSWMEITSRAGMTKKSGLSYGYTRGLLNVNQFLTHTFYYAISTDIKMLIECFIRC